MMDKYKQYASICALTDYADKKSVRRHNQAANAMIKIVEQATQEGLPSIERLFPLLDDPICAKWLAFQLLERAKVNSDIKTKCLKIIGSIATGEGATAFGAKTWLNKWNAN